MKMLAFNAISPTGRVLCCLQPNNSMARVLRDYQRESAAFRWLKQFVERQGVPFTYAGWEPPRMVLDKGVPTECLPVGMAYVWDAETLILAAGPEGESQ